MTKQTQLSRLNAGYVYVLIAASTMSFTGILIQAINMHYQVPALVTAFWRDALAALILLITFLIIKPALFKISRSDLLFLMGYGLFFSVFNIFWTLSVIRSGASVATVLVYSSVPFTALLGWRLLHERLGFPKAAAVLLAFTGCVLVSLGGSNFQTNWIGLSIGLISGLLYALYSLLGRSASKRGLNPWTTSFYTFAFAALVLFVINLLPIRLIPGQAGSFSGLWGLQNQWIGWLFLFLLALGPTVLGFGLYNNSLVFLPSSVANMFMTLEPVLTAVTAFFVFKERLTQSQLLGGSLVIFALLLLRWYEDRLARNELIG